MSQDRRDQSKFDRSAAEPRGIPGPARPAEPVPAAHDPSLAAAAVLAGTAPAAAAPPSTPSAPSVTPTQRSITDAPRPLPLPAGPIPPAGSTAEDDEDYEEEDEPLGLVERLRRVQPAPILLTLGSIGSVVFLLFAVTSHTTPIAVLLSAAVVTGLIFGVDAIIASVVTWRSSQSGETGRAFLAAVVGGVASLVSLGALAGTLVLILVLNS